MSDMIMLALVMGYAYLVGRRVLECVGVGFATVAGEVAAATAIGLGATSYVVFVTGMVNQLNRPAVLCLAALMLAALYVPGMLARGFPALPPSGWRSPRARRVAPESRVECAAEWFRRGVIAITLSGSLAAALAPPTAGDALCYHLEIPKRFIELESVAYLPFTDNSLFPFLMEMLYALGLMLSGPVLAQLMHWAMGVLLALATRELAAPILGDRASGWAAAAALLVPGVTNQMTAPLNDLGLATYATLTLVAWMQWSRTGTGVWLLLAGVFGGLALSIKLVAGALLVPLVLATVYRSARERGTWDAVRSSAVLVIVAGFCGGVWYARSWYHLGNPIYPYFNGFFGLAAHTRSVLIQSANPLALVWQATMHPELYGGRGVQFGAVFLALLPGLALIPRRSELSRLLLVSLGYGCFWFALRQDLRFLLPIVPVLAAASIAVAQSLGNVSRPAFLSAAAALAGLFLFQSMIVVKRARPCVAVAIGRESREDYLRRHEPSYAVAEFVNKNLPLHCRLISQDYRGLYFDREFVREAALFRRMPYDQRDEQLIDFLVRLGFTHALLVDAYNPESAVYDQEFARRLGSGIAQLKSVFDIHYDGPSGDCRDYRLLALPNAVRRVVPADARRDPASPIHAN